MNCCKVKIGLSYPLHYTQLLVELYIFFIFRIIIIVIIIIKIIRVREVVTQHGQYGKCLRFFKLIRDHSSIERKEASIHLHECTNAYNL